MRAPKPALVLMALGVVTSATSRADDNSLAANLARGLESVFQDTQAAQTAANIVGVSSAANQSGAVWQIGNSDFSALQQAISAADNPDAQSAEAQADQAFSNFTSQALPGALVDSMLPPGIKSVVQGAEALAQSVQSTVTSVEVSATAIVDRVSPYFSGNADYGLEPGSPDAEAVQQAVDSSELSMTVDASDIPTTEEDSGSAGPNPNGYAETAGEQDQAPSSQDAGSSALAVGSESSAAEGLTAGAAIGGGATADMQDAANSAAGSVASGRPSPGSSSDLLQDLRQGGIDTSLSGEGDSSAITSSDLAAIGGSGGSDDYSNSINVTQLQSSITNWDQEQAAKAEAEKEAREQAQQQQQAAAEMQQQQSAPAQVAVESTPNYSDASASNSGSGGDCNSIEMASYQQWCHIPQTSACDDARAAVVCFAHAVSAGSGICPESIMQQFQQEAAGAQETANSVCAYGRPSLQPLSPNSGYQAPPPTQNQWYQAGQTLGKLLGKIWRH